MLCYRDREFCSASCLTVDCSRNITPQVRHDAKKWSAQFGADMLIAQRDMSEGCPDYLPAPELEGLSEQHH